jgi:hypothetical protein
MRSLLTTNNHERGDGSKPSASECEATRCSSAVGYRVQHPGKNLITRERTDVERQRVTPTSTGRARLEPSSRLCGELLGEILCWLA